MKPESGLEPTTRAYMKEYYIIRFSYEVVSFMVFVLLFLLFVLF